MNHCILNYIHYYYFYSLLLLLTIVNRAHNEVGWENKLPLTTPSNAPLANLGNTPPDPVSLRFVNKRNELYPQQWQVNTIMVTKI